VSGYGYWLAPIAACMTVDYYLLKRGNLRISSLYTGNATSRYWYTQGVNYRGVAVVILALIPCLPSFAAQIAPNRLGLNDTAYNFFYISFTFTWFCAAGMYYVTYLVWPEKGPEVEQEKSLKWEQLADEGDEVERAMATMSVVEEGAGLFVSEKDDGEVKNSSKIEQS